ncbi:EthD family reductase [Halococcus agarilyticus]|uniref:EthD family reductase n=1 Tax=Halococcus agarilyticus TaxID=1232219 RepID=UPI000677738E|nr:EthD family reductase [Halococcus agarilyticus]
MIKLVVNLVRKEDMSMEEFATHWNEEHAPRASEIPNLRKYTTSVALNPDRSEYDGIAELYFDDPEDVEAAFESEAGQWAVDDLETFTETEQNSQLVLDETVQVDET